MQSGCCSKILIALGHGGEAQNWPLRGEIFLKNGVGGEIPYYSVTNILKLFARAKKNPTFSLFFNKKWANFGLP